MKNLFKEYSIFISVFLTTFLSLVIPICAAIVSVSNNTMMVPAGGGTTKYIGFPNTNGTPSAPVGTLVGYGTGNQDRKYSRVAWTATENGTVQAVNMYIDKGDIVADNAWLCVWNGTTLIGYVEIPTGTGVDWTGYIDLNVEVTDYDYSTNDVLRFGIEYSNSQIYSPIYNDDGASDGYIDYDSTADIPVGGPPVNAAWSTSGTYQGLAVILKCVTR